MLMVIAIVLVVLWAPSKNLTVIPKSRCDGIFYGFGQIKGRIGTLSGFLTQTRVSGLLESSFR